MDTPDTKAGMKDLMLRNQFENSCPPELTSQFKIHKAGTLIQMAEKANAHFSAYGYQTRKEWQGKKPLPPPQYIDQSQQGNQHLSRQHPSYQTYKKDQTKWRSGFHHSDIRQQKTAATAFHHNEDPEPRQKLQSPPQDDSEQRHHKF
ncbi:hypothetical protein Hamer_G010047 [Homarus americanus]|uniref:Uncharacterized protein n=1 Tax=Homarus americanus TaxID=6706 RepID=A0A8J5JGD4_HOMAM|nr:hypothetical protein Hamer_G010047 [Homarus americanus]